MQLIDRTLSILTILSNEADGMSVSEIALKAQISNSAAHRILTSLKNNSFVIQSVDTKKYRLGYKLLTLTRNVSKSNNFTLAADPYMKELSKKLNKTITLSVLESDNIICIHFIGTYETSMFWVRNGVAMPPHATSAGKCILAYYDKKRVKEIYETSHEKITENTIIDYASFENELKKVREKGYAISDEELQVGVQGVACPIFDANKFVVGSIAFTAFKSENFIIEENISLLKEYADKISREISGKTI